VRATKPLFAIGSYWVPPPEEGYNVGLSFGQAPKAFLDILHEKHLVGGGDYFPSHGQTEWDRESLGQYLRTIRDHPALQFVYLDDEPDCRDFEYGGEGRVELGYTAMSMVRKMEFLREACPRQPTFIAINNTWRPACYFVYGELADAMAPHSYGNEIVHSAEQSAQVKRAVEPRASYYTPWLDLGKRPQTAEDMRLRVYYPLSEGMKGIIYYAWKFAATVTPDKGQALRDAMAEMHKEFQAVAPLLIKGELVPMADSSHPALRLRAFLCADEAVVLFVINENRNDFMASDTYRDEAGAPKGKLREVLPTKDVRIDLALPDWFSPGSVVSLSGATATPIPSTVTSPGISLLLPEVGLTKLIVVRRDADKGPRTIALADRRPEDVDYLSDLQPIRVNGIAFSRDRNLQRQPIILGGKTWPKGIGLAAPGEIVYRLDGKYSAFEALIGMDVADLEKNEDLKKALLRLPPSDTHRRAIFLIFVDGVKAFDSGLMRLQDPPRPVRVALSHARELKLVMNEEIVPGGDNGLWAGACLVKP
jgi:hypothetical protein